MRQEHLAHGSIDMGKPCLIPWTVDPETHGAAIGHADIGAQHLMTVIGLAVEQIKRRTKPLGLAHQFIHGENRVGGQIVEQRGFGIVGVMVDAPLPQLDIAGDHHRRQQRLILNAQDQGHEIGLEQ